MSRESLAGSRNRRDVARWRSTPGVRLTAHFLTIHKALGLEPK
jgi:hypothetical protein